MKKAAFGALLGATMLASTSSAMAATNLTAAEVISALTLEHPGGSIYRVAETTYVSFLTDLGTLMAKPDSYAAVKAAFGVSDGTSVSVRYRPTAGIGWSSRLTFSDAGPGSISIASTSGPALYSGTPALATPGPIAGAGIPAVLALLGVGGLAARRRSRSV